ncbi:MAG: endonuclease/exonuclease/phosphatase family protein [Rhodothermaceae bacterium]|nr:endonuclease/exonuclease/phosphatase family protein [Rhodothermaceae bacterium]
MCTFAPLSRFEQWWVRGWDFPRLQLFFLSLLLLTAELLLLDLSFTKSRIIIAAGLACTMYLVWWIIPYTRLSFKEVAQAINPEPDNSLEIMVSNVLMDNQKAHLLLKVVQDNDPDILVTLETNSWWEDQLRDLEQDYPYSIKCPLENRYGMHVYSKLELVDFKIRYLIERDIPSIRARVVLPSGRKVQLHFLHPSPPSPTEKETSKERDAELITIAKEVSPDDEFSDMGAEDPDPVVVTGDLNDVAWSQTTRLFRKISGLLDPRVGRGMYNTFHAEHSLIRWPLDHLFHSHHFNLIRIKRLPYIGSDHFPILVALELTNGEDNEGSGLEASQDDEEMAEDKLSE